MAKLRRGVDELELDVLESETRSLLKQGLTKCDDPFLGTNTASLDHQIVILHNTIVRESTHWSYVFLSPG